MYLITTYGQFDYECYAYDLDSVPPGEWKFALKAIIESGEDITSMQDTHIDPINPRDGTKYANKVFIWGNMRWEEDMMYGKE